MSFRAKIIFSLLLVLSAIPCRLWAQKNVIPTDSSVLAGISLGKNVYLDKRGFFEGIAKTTLELETGKGSLQDMEVLLWENKSRKKAEAASWLDSVKSKLQAQGWTILPSDRDASFSKLSRNGAALVMYMSPGKQEANLYVGRLPGTDTQATAQTETTPPAPAAPGEPVADPVVPADNAIKVVTVKGDITGNWGDISIAKVNYYDPTGYMVGSGLSHGSGYEFKADGTYVQTSLATSSRPDYKIFLYTKGTYSISGNQLTMVPIDLYYRKWEDDRLVTDEHSVPPPDTCQWSVRASSYNGKPCLYLQRKGEAKEREYCKQ